MIVLLSGVPLRGKSTVVMAAAGSFGREVRPRMTYLGSGEVRVLSRTTTWLPLGSEDGQSPHPQKLTLATFSQEPSTWVRMIQRVLPEMRERKRGCIVNVSSIAGKYSFPLFGPYSASKHALEAISDALRMEVRPFGIRVALVEPGYIPTGFQAQARELTWAYVKDVEASPYAQLYKNYGASHKQSMEAAKYTAEDCAQVILRAVRVERPKARYTVTRQAQALSFAKRILPDGFLDQRIGKRLGWK